jgi:2-polyprenyl-6-methoxyphenol hydroxylase-like FAD-dependent oxidoreductase
MVIFAGDNTRTAHYVAGNKNSFYSLLFSAPLRLCVKLFSQEQDMHVLISGAGIAGLTLAYWLHKNGHQPLVIEQAPSSRTEGYMIDFGGSGWDVAQRMGLIPALREKEHAIDHIQFKDGRGQTTAQITLSRLYEAAGVPDKFMVLNRRDLVQVLYEAVEEDVPIRFNTTIQTICQSDTGVTATFNDGTTESFDLLVGADGIHSNVRRLIFGPEDQFSDYLGYRFAVFMTPSLDYELEQTYQIYAEPGCQFSLYPFSESEWLAFVVERSRDGLIPAPPERPSVLRTHLPADRWLIGDVMANLTADSPIFMDRITQIRLPAWSQNRVVLIGDAAYCPSLVSGQGASMAMAGAYFLACELADGQEPQQAGPEYEQQLRPYIEKIQASARRFAPNFVPQSELRLQLVNWLLRLSDIPLVRNLIGKQLVLESIFDDE